MFLVADLLEKVGELVEKLFDLDEELMRSWITAQAKEEEEEEEDAESRLDVALCLLEAAKQLRLGSEIEILECKEFNIHCVGTVESVDIWTPDQYFGRKGGC